jgi:hypothetical protein
MNILLLLAALLPWGASPVSVFSRIYIAVSLLSVEMQVATLTGIGTLPGLVVFNAILAGLLIAWQGTTSVALGGLRSAIRPVVPWAAAAALGGLVLLLNASLPLQAADPYHLVRVAQIERLGTLAYDPAVDSKVNILGWVYELVLADVRQIPLVGPGLVHLHGLFGLLLYGVAVAAVQTWLRPGPSRWPLAALLVVPVLFHQFVLIKNDLFVAAPAFVALAWLVTCADRASPRQTIWAGWLIGLVVGCKLTNLPLAVVMAGGILVAQRGRAWRPLGGLLLGGGIGLVTGGLFLTFLENARWYGDIFASGPVAAIGNRTSGPAEAVVSVARFGISLFDWGLVTPTLWPGRGGWGGTFGLPFIWAVAVLVLHYRRAREARWTLWIAAVHFLAFAAVYPDADVNQRLALAPALLAVAVAVHLLERGEKYAALARLALVPVLVLSGAQIVRSTLLYLAGAGGS